MVWPYLDVAPSRRYAHRRPALSLMLVFITIMLLLSHMGTGRWGVATSGDQEMLQAMSPMEGVGPVRAMPFESWVNGTYCTDDLTKNHALPLVQWGAVPAKPPVLPDIAQPVTCQAAPEGKMHDLVQRFVEEKDRWGARLPNVVGILTVFDIQPNLKQIDLKVIWNVPEVDSGGQLILDSSGKPKLKLVESDYSADGKKELDANGLPKKFMVPGILTSGKSVFVSRLSEYQDVGQ
jgi:hypothetical protein